MGNRKMAKAEGWLSDEQLARRVKGLYDYDQVEVPKVSPEQRHSWDEVLLGYTRDEARVEAQRCMQCQDPPCVTACPAHLDIPGYCQAIVDDDLERGLKIITDAFPIPGACARVCYHPCTDVCLKGVDGIPIEIPRLRRFITDNFDQRALDYHLPPASGFSIAVIGSGPTGLGCAYHLRRYGHHVVLYERSAVTGGTLNTIPEYRLPRALLQQEIDTIKWLGVEIKTEHPIEGDGCLDRLLEQFDVVFIAAGAVSSREIRTPGAELAGVYHGYDLLHRLHAGEKLLGKRLAVIGGGDVAMDSLRTALRTCEEVHLIYRRSPLEMPANREEVWDLTEEALHQEWHHVAVELTQERRAERFRELFSNLELLTMERMAQVEKELSRELKVESFAHFDKCLENLVVHFMVSPVRVLGDEQGRVKELELVRMELGQPDESGRRRPVPIEGSEFVISVDTVIFAIGQEIDPNWLGVGHGLELESGNRLKTDEQFETSRPWVFAGGDAMRGPSNMIQALGDGRYAAAAIDQKLRARLVTKAGRDGA